MVLEENCVASESVSGGWTVEDSVLETWSGPKVSLLQAEKLKRSIPARKKEKIRVSYALPKSAATAKLQNERNWNE